jgi:hypothetical protein
MDTAGLQPAEEIGIARRLCQASQALCQTRRAYVIALNHTSQPAFDKQVFNSLALHHITYRDVCESITTRLKSAPRGRAKKAALL